MSSRTRSASLWNARAGIACAAGRTSTIRHDGPDEAAITVNCVAPGTHMTETLHEILVNSDPHRLDAASCAARGRPAAMGGSTSMWLRPNGLD